MNDTAIAHGLGPALQREPLPLQVARRIVQSIVRGELKPGQRLPNERELAATLGVARPTVREAIRALQMMHILTVRQGGATQVSELSPEALVEPFELMCYAGALDLNAVFEVRLTLEVGAARLAAERITDQELSELRDCMARAEQAVTAPRRFMDIDIEFHDRIFAATRNALFTSLMRAIQRLGIATRTKTTQVNEIRRRAMLDHCEIVAALARHDPEAAGAAMFHHISNVARRYQERLTSYENQTVDAVSGGRGE